MNIQLIVYSGFGGIAILVIRRVFSLCYILTELLI